MQLFFDTETTGLSSQRDHLVQIAWLLTDRSSNIILEECYVIRPDGYSIPRAATNIHGITTATACEIGRPLAEVLQQFSDAAAKASIVIAHNLSFDMGILRHDYKVACLPFPLHGKTQICTMRLSTTWCRLPKLNGSPGFKWPTLAELHYRLFGEGFDGAHDALEDVRACQRCYVELIKRKIITPPQTAIGQITELERYSPAKTVAGEEQFALGIACMNSRNDEETAKWFRLAAEQGHAAAQYMMGIMCEDGRGVIQNYLEAMKWYRLAAEQGDAAAQNKIGEMYESGRGVTQDYKEAEKWFCLAVHQGDFCDKRILGHRYFLGKGVTQSHEEAVRWFRLAADHGSIIAKRLLGHCYLLGKGVNQNHKEAERWYRLAADQGDATAQCRLGWMYISGCGVPQNYQEAENWYRLASEQDNDRAKYHAILLHNSKQGTKDYEIAAQWRRLADQQSEADVIASFEELGNTGLECRETLDEDD